MTGLAALLLLTEERLGSTGVPPVLIAWAGAASIVGPASSIAGADADHLGAGVRLSGTKLIGAARLWRDRRCVAPVVLWPASPGFLLTGQFAMGDACFGAGFLAAGAILPRRLPA